jgi:hypothetical protein
VASLLFTQNILLAHSAETNFWESRQKSVASLASLPNINSRLDSVLKSSMPTTFVPAWIQTAVLPFATLQEAAPSKEPHAKTVFLLQDLHLHFEAQTNIAATIDSLARALKSKNSHLMVGMEGADVAIDDFSRTNSYPHRKVLRQAAQAMLKANILNGTEYAAFGYLGENAEGPVSLPFTVTGVEDWDEYKANVEAIRDAVPLKDKVKSALSDLKRTLAGLKKKYYTPEMNQYDAKRTAFEQGTLGLPDYVLYLDSVLPAPGRNTRLLIEAALMEGSIDFAKVEMERSRMLEDLIRKLTEKETNTLLQVSLLFKSGEVSYTGYYNHIKNMAACHGLRLRQYPEMNLYIRYVLKSESIDHKGLFAELKLLEEAVFNKLCSNKIHWNEHERQIALLSEDYTLLTKLSNHILTEEEWRA